MESNTFHNASLSKSSHVSSPVLVGAFCEMPCMISNDVEISGSKMSRSKFLTEFFRENVQHSNKSNVTHESRLKYLALSVGMSRTLLSMVTQNPLSLLSKKKKGLRDGIYEWGKDRQRRSKVDFLPTFLKHEVFTPKDRKSRSMVRNVRA